jgi:ketosteroid isomerase-like protein
MRETPPSELNARRFFELLHEQSVDGLRDFLHEQVVFRPRVMTGRLFQGREEVLRLFYDDVFGWPLYEPVAHSYTPVTAELVVVEGRVRWLREGRLHDTATVWLLQFKDDKLFRLEAQTSKEEALTQARTQAGKDSRS